MQERISESIKRSLGWEDVENVVDNTLVHQLKKSVYIDSYYEFFKDAFKVLHPREKYDENWHLKYMADVLQAEFERIQRGEPRKNDIIINVPFRSAKSMLCTVIFPVWCWAIDPTFKVISVSYSESLALEHAGLSRDLVYSSWFQSYFGETVKIKYDDNAKSFYKTTEGGFRKAVGTGGQILGSGADIIILDDPQNPKQANSEKERQNTIDFYTQTLYSRLNQPSIGIRVVVMQRLHEIDLSGYLIATRPNDHKHICIPAEIFNPATEKRVKPQELLSYYQNKLFWPTRFSVNELHNYLNSLLPKGYAGQLQQSPSPDEGNLIKKRWFQYKSVHEIEFNIYDHPIHFVVDTAYTEKSENDPNAIMAFFVKDNFIYIVHVEEKRLEFPQLCEYIQKYTKTLGYTSGSIIFVEPKASGKSVVQQLKSETMLNIVEFESDILKDDKPTRLTGIAPLIRSGRVILVKGSWNHAFVHQVCMQPNAAHWDMTDCLVMACDTFKNQSFQFEFIG